LVTYDTIIRDGRWFDGTGAASAVRNIGVRDGHVVAISPDDLDDNDCPQVIDATGKWVLPGMLDIHTHYDVEVLNGPSLSESLRHGVTTVMLGSCSLSTVHVGGVDAGDIFGRVEAIPREYVIGAVDKHTRHGRTPRNTSRRSRRDHSAPTLRRSSAIPTCTPRRWAWIAPRRRSSDRPKASRLRWSACSRRRWGPPRTRPPPSPPKRWSSQVSVEDTVHGMWKALSARDWESLKTYLSDDCIYLDMPVGPAAAARGPEDIVKRLKIGLEPLASYENFDGLMLDNGTDVMYEHHEEWHWPTGESAVLKFVTVHRVDNDKITLWKDYWDMGALANFAPPSWMEGFANADMSWVFDATGLV
jgi:limonene-1,2-epoxide hydrolase